LGGKISWLSKGSLRNPREGKAYERDCHLKVKKLAPTHIGESINIMQRNLKSKPNTLSNKGFDIWQ
jgi:hypothetical protein